MAFAATFIGAVGGMVAGAIALALGAGWAVALVLYVLGGTTLAFALTITAALRPARRTRVVDLAPAAERARS